MRQGILMRGMAAFLDWVIMMVAACLLVFILVKIAPSYLKDLSDIRHDALQLRAEHLRRFGLSCLVLFPFIIMEAFFGTSPGKLALRLRIGCEDGVSASVGRLLFRFFVKYGFILLFGLAPIIAAILGRKAATFLLLPGSAWSVAIFFGYFMVLGESKQTLHDRIAGTGVFSVHDLEENSLSISAAPRAPRARPQSASDPNDLFKPRW